MSSLPSLPLRHHGRSARASSMDRNRVEKTLGPTRSRNANLRPKSLESRGSVATGFAFIGSVPRRRHSSSIDAFDRTSSDICSIPGSQRRPKPYTKTPNREYKPTEIEERKERRPTTYEPELIRPRQRTFPIASCLQSTHAPNVPVGTLPHVYSALDFLFLGLLVYDRDSSSPSPATFRAAKSLIKRHREIKVNIGQPFLDAFESCISRQDQSELNLPPREKSELTDAMAFAENLKQKGLVKGNYKTLEAEKLDLPDRSPPFHASVWLQSLPESVNAVFAPERISNLTTPVIDALNNAVDIPPPRVHSFAGEYPKVLNRLHSSGMIEWSFINSEDSQYSRMANALTMTSFSVVKDEFKDRLISWPRVQNLLFPEPEPVKLPNPGHFTRLRKHPGSSLSSIFLDVENMFHNIRLPTHLTLLFPLKAIAYGDLPGTVQRDIEEKLGFRPRQRDAMRPLQCTLPMGFKWAVYIAQTFLESCYCKALESFLHSSKFFGVTLPIPSIVVLHDCETQISLSRGCLLILHIIDDLNLVAVDWPESELLRLQNTIETVLQQNYLPVKRKKSSPLGYIEKEAITFIGWIWYFKSDMIRPKPDKLIAAATALSRVTNYADFQSVAGTLVWILLGTRPLLSVLYRTYQYLRNPVAASASLHVAVKRELLLSVKLSFLSQVRVVRQNWSRVIAFDASLSGGAVVYTDTSEDWIQHLLESSFKQDFSSDDGFQNPMSLLKFVSTHKWKTAFVHQWRRPQHINALEPHTAVLAIEWATSFPITGNRILLLSDSMVCIGAFQKGRSSSPMLCLPCRMYAALCLAHDLDAHFLHIPSAFNPADSPSRSKERAAHH